VAARPDDLLAKLAHLLSAGLQERTSNTVSGAWGAWNLGLRSTGWHQAWMHRRAQNSPLLVLRQARQWVQSRLQPSNVRYEAL